MITTPPVDSSFKHPGLRTPSGDGVRFFRLAHDVATPFSQESW